MLGIGVFIGPRQVALNVDSVESFFILWVAGGVLALAGALCLAELGANLPRSGGEYSYLRSTWGPGVAFAAGALQLLAIFPGSLATVAVATATYQVPELFGPTFAEPVLGLPAPAFWGAVMLVALTVVNHAGVRLSGYLQACLTLIPLGVFAAAAIATLTGLVTPGPLTTTPVPPADTGFSAFAQAYMPVYFAFSGWNAALYVGAEIDNPKRNLARALIWGTGIVAGVYLLLCAAFLKTFGLVGLRSVYEAGTATAVALFGPAGATGMTVLLLLAMLGTLNGTILIGSRIAVVMAARGEAPAIATTLNRRRTPVVALWLQTALSVLLVSFGQHVETLLNYTTSAMLLTGSLVVLSMLALRRRGVADGTWTYRVPAFPLAPALYVGSSVAVLAFVFAERGIREGVVAIWFVGCLVGHRVFLQRRRGTTAPEADTLSG